MIGTLLLVSYLKKSTVHRQNYVAILCRHFRRHYFDIAREAPLFAEVKIAQEVN